jgi:hypothetical protein
MGAYAAEANVVAISSAARVGSSCSQTRITVQPAACSAASLRRSLSTFRSSFACQYTEFMLGLTPWTGQRCQKHPSTKTANRADGKTMSALHLTLGSGRRFLKKRSLRAWSAERKARSGPVSELRLAVMTARALSELAGGAAGSREGAEPSDPMDFVVIPTS